MTSQEINEIFKEVMQYFGQKNYHKVIEIGKPAAFEDTSLLICQFIFESYLYLGDIDEGYKYVQYANEKDPANPFLFENKCCYLFNKGRYPELNTYLNELLALNPHAAPVHKFKAKLLMQLHKLPQARVHLEAAIDADPQDGSTLRELIQLNIILDDLDRAMLYCNKLQELLAIAPSFTADFYYLLAKTFFQREEKIPGIGQLDSSQLDSYKTCSMAINTNNANYDCYMVMGNIFARSHRFADAVSYIDTSISFNKANHEAYERKGDLLVLQNKYQEAVHEYNYALHLNPTREHAFFNRGLSEFYLNKHAESEQSFFNAIQTSMGKSYSDTAMVLGKFTHTADFVLAGTIKEKQIWFSNPAGFNDPLDGNYLSKTHEEITPLKNQLARFLVTCFRYFKDNEQPLQAFAPYEQLMWSHYADRHKGILLLYEKIPNFNIDHFKKYAVNYVSQFNYPSKSLISTINNNFMITLNNNFFTKFREWEYEQEFRLIKYEADEKHANGRCYGLNELNLQLKGIVFGLNCPAHTKAEIKQLVKNNYDYPVELVEIVMSSSVKNHFELSKQKYL